MGPKRIAVALLAAATLVVLAAPAASGGGSAFETEQERYAPGERVHAWTSVDWSYSEHAGTPADGPYEAYLLPLRPDGTPLDSVGTWLDPVVTWPDVPADALHVGQLEVSLEPYAAADGFRYGPHSAVLEFELPEIPDGTYEIRHCDEPCTTTLGSITWGSVEVAGSTAPSLAEVPWDEQVERLRIQERRAALGPIPEKLVASGQPPQPGAALPGLAVAVLVSVAAVGIWLARRSGRRAGLAVPAAVEPRGAHPLPDEQAGAPVEASAAAETDLSADERDQDLVGAVTSVPHLGG